MGKLKDITGFRYGRLLVLSRKPNAMPTMWTCLCDCGEVKSINAHSLKSGRTKSCGCLSANIAKQLNTSHGKTHTSIYNTYCTMIQRCHNPNSKAYNGYGGVGITVCDRWRESFENFYKDMGDKPSKEHSIDRIDNKRGYTVDNCRWATKIQQANNCSSNKLITYNGEVKTISEWALEFNLPYSCLWQRIGKLKWTTEKALNTKCVIGANQFSKL